MSSTLSPNSEQKPSNASSSPSLTNHQSTFAGQSHWTPANLTKVLSSSDQNFDQFDHSIMLTNGCHDSEPIQNRIYPPAPPTTADQHLRSMLMMAAMGQQSNTHSSTVPIHAQIHHHQHQTTSTPPTTSTATSLPLTPPSPPSANTTTGGPTIPFGPMGDLALGLVRTDKFPHHPAAAPITPYTNPILMMKMMMGNAAAAAAAHSFLDHFTTAAPSTSHPSVPATISTSDTTASIANGSGTILTTSTSTSTLKQSKTDLETEIDVSLEKRDKSKRCRSTMATNVGLIKKQKNYSANRRLVPSTVTSMNLDQAESNQNKQQMNDGQMNPRPENPIYRCHLCPYTGNSKLHFNAHMNTHFDHRCPHCDYTSRTEGRLKRHIRDFHSETPPETWTGTGCGSSNRLSIDEQLLLEGAELIDADGNVLMASDAIGEMCAGGTGPNPARNRKYRCKQCGYVAMDKHDFWEHSKDHIKSDKMLACPKCNFVTEYKHHLEYHLRNHFGSKPFKCAKCNYSCVNKSMLNSHMKSHSNIYQYRCDDCTYATKYCHSLKLHLRKYKHRPATVLNLDGTPNPYPVIDVYGTRRGPRPKKQPQLNDPTANIHANQTRSSTRRRTNANQNNKTMNQKTTSCSANNQLESANVSMDANVNTNMTNAAVMENNQSPNVINNVVPAPKIINGEKSPGKPSSPNDCGSNQTTPTTTTTTYLKCNYCPFQTESKPDFSNHLLNHVVNEKISLLNSKRKQQLAKKGNQDENSANKSTAGNVEKPDSGTNPPKDHPSSSIKKENPTEIERKFHALDLTKSPGKLETEDATIQQQQQQQPNNPLTMFLQDFLRQNLMQISSEQGSPNKKSRRKGLARKLLCIATNERQPNTNPEQTRKQSTNPDPPIIKQDNSPPLSHSSSIDSEFDVVIDEDHDQELDERSLTEVKQLLLSPLNHQQPSDPSSSLLMIHPSMLTPTTPTTTSAVMNYNNKSFSTTSSFLDLFNKPMDEEFLPEDKCCPMNIDDHQIAFNEAEIPEELVEEIEEEEPEEFCLKNKETVAEPRIDQSTTTAANQSTEAEFSSTSANPMLLQLLMQMMTNSNSVPVNSTQIRSQASGERSPNQLPETSTGETLARAIRNSTSSSCSSPKGEHQLETLTNANEIDDVEDVTNVNNLINKMHSVTYLMQEILLEMWSIKK